eukprot:gene15473-17693_t
MAEGGDQLVSFFAYSLFVYPVTNYIVSPQRKYPRWKAALYAVVFLLAISTLHMVYDNMETGPNHYQILRVNRNTPLNVIKKSYRHLSLELHPDKNKDPAAADEFLKVKHAFDILSDKDKKKEYNRLGENGVKILAQSVVDHKYILLQMVVHYVSTLIFAFLMTFSEPTADAFNICLFGLSVMLLVEMVLVLQEVPLPSWFLPDTTPHDIVSALHRLFPAFMNGGRCISGAFYVDRKAVRVAALDAVNNSSKEITLRACNLARTLLEEKLQREESESDVLFSNFEEEDEEEDSTAGEEELQEHAERGSTATAEDTQGADAQPAFTTKRKASVPRVGIMEKQMSEVRRRVATTREGRDGSIAAMVADKVKLISDPARLRKAAAPGWNTMGLLLLRDLSIYLVARFVFMKPSRV